MGSELGKNPTGVWIIVAVAIAANAAGYLLNLWNQIWWYDDLVHGYTIFAITLLLGVLAFGPALKSIDTSAFWVILTITCIGVAVGAWWEVAEWAYDQVFTQGSAVQGKTDTIVDLITDSIGALLGGWLAYAWRPRRAGWQALEEPADLRQAA